MKRKTTIRGGAALVDECAAAIQEKYCTKRYDVQRSICQEKEGISILVTINVATSSLGRILRNLSGLNARACLKLTPMGEDLDVRVFGGRWWDKLFAGVICWFFLWWLLATMFVGIILQRKLHGQVYKETLQWFDSRKAWLGGQVVKIRTSPRGRR